jgi:hypothetical protein
MMLGTSRRVLLCAIVAGCGTGDTRVDPGDLALRDLLGVAPEVASHWNADERAAARKVLIEALHAPAAPADVGAGSIEDRIAALDGRRADAGDDALGLIVLVDAKATPVTTDLSDAAVPVPIAFDDNWHLQPVQPQRGAGVLATFGIDAGHASGPMHVIPAAHLAAIAAYDHGTLVVNPVVIAALEPAAGAAMSNAAVVEVARVATTHVPHPQSSPASGVAEPDIGNPYSFYGSVEECAAAQQSRCNACLPSNSCVPVTNTTDGNAECTTLGANNGRGYFLLCINAALAISSVDTCAAKDAANCARNTKAADSLADLEANADFLDDMTCNSALDSCLAKIFGAPGQSFPGFGTDAGTTEPPRSTDVSCGNSCSNNNCQASPNWSCSGPSCGNSLSCDSSCANSNNQSGCGGNCNSCDSSASGGGGGGGCSSSSSGGSSSGGSCSGGSSSGGSSSSCGSCGSSSSSGGSSCGGGSCGGSSSSNSSSCGGSGGGQCGVARGEPNAAFALFLSVGWGLLPVPFAARARRRARRAKKEVQS